MPCKKLRRQSKIAFSIETGKIIAGNCQLETSDADSDSSSSDLNCEKKKQSIPVFSRYNSLKRKYAETNALPKFFQVKGSSIKNYTINSAQLNQAKDSKSQAESPVSDKPANRGACPR